MQVNQFDTNQFDTNRDDVALPMSDDDLTKPLGMDRDAKKASRKSLPVARITAMLCGALLASVAGFAAFTNDPLGGEPMVVASIDKMPKRETGPAPQAPVSAQPESPNVREVPQQNRSQRGAAELENDAGVKVLRTNGQAPGSVIIRVPDAQPSIRLAPAPDRRLIEKNRHGNLPKIGPDALRASDVYARPVTQLQKVAAVRVAIVIGGLGISNNITQDAIQRLPGPVSLAFAPYGADLERQVTRARDDGHEVLLQTPMEPFDYPDNDPGPQTLVSTLSAEQNLDRLQWLMSRFSGYIGVVNYMGGRFTSTDAALAPVMKEIASRGLLYLDDGSSGRSMAAQVAAGAGASSARADVVIDAIQRGADIDIALTRLEKIAREKGSAIGYAAALPVTLERIARWSRAAEAKGITLVPLSAVVTSPKRS
ncbi:MAG: divergent polysaccharide deacetylase family protein [Beijerinckiaceae bacterium]